MQVCSALLIYIIKPPVTRSICKHVHVLSVHAEEPSLPLPVLAFLCATKGILVIDVLHIRAGIGLSECQKLIRVEDLRLIFGRLE